MKAQIRLLKRCIGLSIILLSYECLAFYNANAGRWVSRDPMEEKGGQNLYAFVFNNSPSYIDAHGDVSKAIIDMLSGMGREDMLNWLKNNATAEDASEIYELMRKTHPEKAGDVKWAAKFAKLRRSAHAKNAFAELRLLKLIALGGCISSCAVVCKACLDKAECDLDIGMDTTTTIADPEIATSMLDTFMEIFYIDTATCSARYLKCALTCCVPFL
jgi:hypothetical protein